MFVYVPAFVVLYGFVCACALPFVLMAHHGAPAEHCCISASLGLSQRSSKRPDPAGNGLGTENGKTGKRKGRMEGGRETRQCIKEQKMKGRERVKYVAN